MAKAKSPRNGNGAAKPANLVTAAAELREIKPIRKASKQARPESTHLVVPLNLNDEIRRRAYELWEQCGYQSGHENEHWLSAEREILSRYHHGPLQMA